MRLAIREGVYEPIFQRRVLSGPPEAREQDSTNPENQAMTTMTMERNATTEMPKMMGNMTMSNGTMMVPRCTIKMEKCTGGMKIYCCCDDDKACCTLQSLCESLAGSACSCCCMWNGMMMCQCNLCCCACTCETTEEGVCFTCISGDKKCCEMIQACCDCLICCMKDGCCSNT